jgi:guanylate kinase
VEHAEVAGNLYGTPGLDAPPGKDVLLEIDVQGARQILARHPDAVMILVVPPSRAVQEERLRRRGDDPETVARRLAISEQEEQEGRKLAHHVVVNDDLNRAVEEVAGIIERHRAVARP